MFEYLGISKASATAGAMGAALAALQGSNRTKTERAVNFASGFLIACYLPPLIIAWAALKESPSFFGGLGFFCGYFGMALCDAAVQAGKILKSLDWKEIALSWLKPK